MNQISTKVARAAHRKWKYGVKSRETEIKRAEKNSLYLEILRGDLSWFFCMHVSFTMAL